MVRKFSDEENNNIIADSYAGTPRKDIEERYSASGGYVSKLMQEEKRLVGEHNVDALRRLAIEIGKKGCTVVDIFETVRLQNALKQETGMGAEEVLEYTLKIVERCKKDGIDLKNLAHDNNSKIKEAKELDRIVAEKRKAKEEAEKRLQYALAKEDQTYERLEEHHESRCILEEYGLSPDGKQVEKFANVLYNADTSKYDLEEIVQQLSEHPSLKKENEQLRAHNANIQKVINSNTDLLRQQAAAINQNSKLFGMVSRADSLGFELPEMEAVVEALNKISINNGIDSKAAVKKFIGHIKNGDYDTKLGFEKSTSDCKKENDVEKAKLEKTKLENSRYANGIAAVQALESKGVKIHEIVEIKYIIENSGVAVNGGGSITELKNDIMYYGSLKSANKQYEKINKELQTKNLALEEKNKLLERHNEALENTTDAISNSFTEDIQKCRNETKAYIEALDGIVVQSKQVMNGQLGVFIEEINKFVNRMNEIFNMQAEVQKRILQNTRILDYEPLARAKSGEVVSIESMMAALILAIEPVLPHLGTSVASRNIRISLQMAKNQLADYLNHPPHFE